MVLINSWSPNRNRPKEHHEGFRDQNGLPGLPTRLCPLTQEFPFSYIQLFPWKPVPTASLSTYREGTLKCRNTSLVRVFFLDGTLTSPEGMPLMCPRISCAAEFFSLLIHAAELWNILSALITTTSQGGMRSNINYIMHTTHLLEVGYPYLRDGTWKGLT